MPPSGLLCGIRDGQRGQGCTCAPSNKQRSSEGGVGTFWDSRHTAIRKPTVPQVGCPSQVCLQGTRHVFATFWPRALQHSDPGLLSWSLLLVGAYWKGTINNVNWGSQLTALTWLSIKWEMNPPEALTVISLVGQGIEEGFLAQVSRELHRLCHIWVRGKIFKQNSYDLKTRATQTAVSNSIQCQSSTLSCFIWFGFEVAIKTRKPPDLGHC